MFKILFWCLFIYLAYRFIFELVIPISKTAGQLKRKMTEMQQNQAFQQETHNRSQSQQPQSQQRNGGNTAVKKDDYIEFEEVK
ncbi:MAG: hypothetical protein EAZ35_11295 [Sphingobacteriia bacterium]|jgi:hypothetical protein|nr:MAG: hypothetical protein EAZ35_11295 [Sphingobacteriia bacterium]